MGPFYCIRIKHVGGEVFLHNSYVPFMPVLTALFTICIKVGLLCQHAKSLLIRQRILSCYLIAWELTQNHLYLLAYNWFDVLREIKRDHEPRSRKGG